MEWSDYLRFIAALLFVLALMGGLSILIKKLGWGGASPLRPQRRLQIVETLPLDARHKAVLLRLDQTEHLVILNPNSETLIASGIASEPVSDTLEVKKKDSENEPLLPF